MHSERLNTTPDAGLPADPAQIQSARLNKRKEIVDDYGDDEFLFLSEPEYDEAILGVAKRIGQPDVIAYDANKIYEILAKMLNTEDWTVVFEYFEYNILGVYVGEKTPVFVDVV